MKIAALAHPLQALRSAQIALPEKIILGGGVALFVFVATRCATYLPLQASGWAVFLAMIILPGYLITRMVTYHLNLDELDRLAIALPAGIAAYAIPGLVVLLLHLTYHALHLAWIIEGAVVLLAYLGFLLIQTGGPMPAAPRWHWTEIILLVFLTGTFAVCYSSLTTYSVDGDLLTFLSKISEEMTGRAMNISEPIFGSGLPAGVRSEFNQFSPIWTLWSYLSGNDAIDITAYVSRAIFGLWAILASYLFGKAAGNNQRRLGLFTAAIQMLIILAAPFFRTDNYSLFYLQRTNADKFTVSITMLPVVFGLGIDFIREGRRGAWLMAALSAFAISTIHPLIAAIAALGLGAFGAFHLLLHPKTRASWLRVIGLGVVAVICMVLPLVLLVMSRSSAPLAPTYPTSFEGWSIGEEQNPALPFTELPNLDWYGPVPDLATLQPEDANSSTSPFLVWRYAFNMRRQRLIIFSLNRYISTPGILLEPAYLAALLCTPILFFGLRSHLGAQFSIAAVAALIFTMYNPIVTPIIGKLVVPWLLWRMVWLLPFAFMLAQPLDRVFGWIGRLLAWAFRRQTVQTGFVALAPVVTILATTVIARPMMITTLQETQYQLNLPNLFPIAEKIFDRLNQEITSPEGETVAASQSLSVTLPAYVAKANVIGHRVFNTSEFFPATMQDVALERLIDQNDLFNTPYLTETSIEVLKQYDARYIITSSGSSLDFQVHLSSAWFEWIMDDQGFSLYRIKDLPGQSESILGNTDLAENRFDEARAHFEAALAENPDDLLACAGLSSAYRAQGLFNEALTLLQKIENENVSLTVQYRLGQLYAEMDQTERARALFEKVTQTDPTVSRYQLALGNVCNQTGDSACAQAAFEAAYAESDSEVNRLTSLGRTWLQRGNAEQALTYYQKAAELLPAKQILINLASAYEALGQYDQAEQTLLEAQEKQPFSADVYLRMAEVKINRGEIDAGISLYQKTIWLEELEMKDSSLTRLALATQLTQVGRLTEAESELNQVLKSQPYNTSAYILLGNVYLQENRAEEAVTVYQKALELDPTQSTAYLSLTDVYQQQAALDENLDMLQRGVTQNPQEPRMFIYLGNQLQRLGNTETAISAYQIALSLLEPDENATEASQRAADRLRASIDGQLAGIYEDQGDFEKALNYYQAAASANPTNTLTQIQLGAALLRRNDTAGAEQVYRTVLAADPQSAGAMLGLADIYAAQGDQETASTWYQQALQVAMETADQPGSTMSALASYLLADEAGTSGLILGSGNDTVSSGDPSTDGVTSLGDYLQFLESDSASTGVDALAQIYQRTGQVDKAIELYQKEIQAGQGVLSTAILSGYYSRLASLTLDQGFTDQAITYYQQAIDLDSSSTSPRLGLTNAWLAQGKAAEAVAELEAIAQEQPGIASVQLALARAVEQSGDASRASQIYHDTASAHPGSETANLALARFVQGQGQTSEAAAIYQKIITAFPGSAAAYTGLANLYRDQADLNNAEATLRKALGVDSTYASANLALGSVLERQGKAEDAIDAYEKAIRFAPFDINGYLSLASVYQTQGEVEQAEAVLQQGIQNLPGATQPLLQLASLYQEQGQFEQAESLLLQAVDRDPTSAPVRLALADYYLSQAQSDLALVQLQQAATDNPTSMEVVVRYANQLYALGQTELAEPLYQQAESATPSAAGYRALSAARSAQGQLDQALTWIQQALELAPADPLNWERQAELQAQLGQTDQQLASLQTAVSLAPGQSRTWLALGQALLADGQRAKGLEALEQARSVDPTSFAPYQALIDAYQGTDLAGRIPDLLTQVELLAPGNYQVDLLQASLLIEQSDWSSAETEIRQAIAKAPGLSQPYLSLADLFARQSLFSPAIQAYQQALQNNPSQEAAYTNIASLYASQGQVEQAEAVLQQGIQNLPGSTQPLLQLASLYQEQGQFEQAESLLLQAVERAPTAAPVRLALADYYLSQAQSDLALVQLQQAATDNPTSMEVVVRYANQLYALGQTELAEPLYQQAEKATPSAAGYRALSAARSTQGQLDQALTWIQQALELAPADPLNWERQAELQAQLGQTDQQLASLQTAVSLAPGQSRTWLALGQALLADGQRAKGLEALEQARSVDPTSFAPYQALIDAYQGTDLAGRIPDLLTQVELLAPGNYQVDLLQASLLIEQSDWSSAETEIRQAIAKAPGLSQPYLSLADLFARQSLFSPAIQAYQQALQANPLSQPAVNGLTRVYLRMGLTDEDAAFRVKAAYLQATFSLSGQTQPGVSSWLLDQEYP